jgi:hypothetical protein
MDKKYTYNSIEYSTRNKSFKPYRIKAIIFSEKYNKFEKEYCGDIQEEINNFLYTDKKVMGKVISAKNTGDTNKLNTVIQESLLSDPLQLSKLIKLTERKNTAKEMFLLDTVNAKELCDIMLNESETINHEPDGDELFSEYYAFLTELMTDFFLKLVTPIHTANK